jgi:hypothetical protein
VFLVGFIIRMPSVCFHVICFNFLGYAWKDFCFHRYKVAQKGVSMAVLQAVKVEENQKLLLEILNCCVMHFSSRLRSVKACCFHFSHSINKIAWNKYSGFKESEITHGTSKGSNKFWWQCKRNREHVLWDNSLKEVYTVPTLTKNLNFLDRF